MFLKQICPQNPVFKKHITDWCGGCSSKEDLQQDVQSKLNQNEGGFSLSSRDSGPPETLQARKALRSFMGTAASRAHFLCITQHGWSSWSLRTSSASMQRRKSQPHRNPRIETCSVQKIQCFQQNCTGQSSLEFCYGINKILGEVSRAKGGKG